MQIKKWHSSSIFVRIGAVLTLFYMKLKSKLNFIECDSSYEIFVKRKCKVRPCTGTEALYRLYGP